MYTPSQTLDIRTRTGRRTLDRRCYFLWIMWCFLFSFENIYEHL